MSGLIIKFTYKKPEESSPKEWVAMVQQENDARVYAGLCINTTDDLVYGGGMFDKSWMTDRVDVPDLPSF